MRKRLPLTTVANEMSLKHVALLLVLAGSLLLTSSAAAVDNVLNCGTLRAFDPPTPAKNVGSATIRVATGDKTWNLSGTPGPNSVSPQATVGSEVCLTGEIAKVDTGPENLLIRWNLAPNVAPASAPSIPVVYCGVVSANSVTSGQGSSPRSYELQVTSGPGGGGRFAVPESIALPTIGSYICGQFVQGVPMNGLVALLRPGDPGYVAQTGTASSTPALTAAPIAVPIGVAQPPSGVTLGVIELLLLGLALLAVIALFTLRSRRSST